MTERTFSPVRGAAAGLAAGLVASLAMDQFQKVWARFVTMPKGGAPATVNAADKASRAVNGTPVAKADKAGAGTMVHYLFGGALGAAYGVAAEYRPAVTRGFGSAFGLGTATMFDEVAVPAAGLSKAPTEFGLRTHAYSYASHLVFGAATEAVRRVLRAR